MLSGGLTTPRAPRLGSSSSSSDCRRRPSAPLCSSARRPSCSTTAAAASTNDDAAAGATTTTTATTATTTTTTTSTTSTTSTQQPRYTRATLRTTDACELAVSIYPFFRYKASGGGGDATVVPAPSSASDDGTNPHLLRLSFDPASLRVPALDYRTALLFGLVPIPPPLSIAIRPLSLEGTLDARTGSAELAFDAEFCFTAGALYRAPPLRVRTVLTTGRSSGLRLGGAGRAWGGASEAAAGGPPSAAAAAGAGGGSSAEALLPLPPLPRSPPSAPSPSQRSIRLAGVALVPKTGDAFLDAFLMLPNDALAVLEGELELEMELE